MSLVKELARDEALRDKSLMVVVCEEDLFLPLLRQILLSSSGEVHWLREKKYDKLPDLPRELLSCPERLSRIFFHTGDLVERITHFCSHTTNYSRSPVETLIVELSAETVTHEYQAAAVVAILSAFAHRRCSSSALPAVILAVPPESDTLSDFSFPLIASLYTDSLFAIRNSQWVSLVDRSVLMP